MDVSETFHSTFIGERVEIVAGFYQNYREETADSVVTNNAPASIQGYILDIDEHYVYLGKNPSEVSMAIRRDTVLYIEVLVEKNEYDVLLDSLPQAGRGEEN
jgi:hypothetical protein